MFCRAPRTRRFWGTTLNVDAFEQVVQLALCDHDDACAIERLRKLEHSLIQTLVQHAQPGPIEEQNLKCGATLPEEEKQRATACGALHALLRESCQTVEAETHIDRLYRNKDFDPVRNH